MDLKEIVSVSNLPGLHKVVAQRNDGLIVQQLGEERSKFASSRSHMFTPLDGITIYTEDDSATLSDVLWTMKQLSETNTPPNGKKASSAELSEYFRKVLPDYDEERVYVSDIKKLLKWYELLDAHGLITEPVAEEETATEVTEEKAEEKAEAEEPKEEKKKPAKKKAKKAKKEEPKDK